MSDSSKSRGISFGGLLTVLFIGLKLTEYITWPWLWVLAPLWIPLAIVGVFILGGSILGLIYIILSMVFKK